MNFLVLIEIAGFPRACHIYCTRYITTETHSFSMGLDTKILRPQNFLNQELALLLEA